MIHSLLFSLSHSVLLRRHIYSIVSGYWQLHNTVPIMPCDSYNSLIIITSIKIKAPIKSLCVLFYFNLHFLFDIQYQKWSWRLMVVVLQGALMCLTSQQYDVTVTDIEYRNHAYFLITMVWYFSATSML